MVSKALIAVIAISFFCVEALIFSVLWKLEMTDNQFDHAQCNSLSRPPTLDLEKRSFDTSQPTNQNPDTHRFDEPCDLSVRHPGEACKFPAFSDTDPYVPYVAIKQGKYGKLLFLPGDSIIGGSIGMYGEYCEPEAVVFRKFIKTGDVVMDLGSNVGAHMVTLARIVGPTGRVYAVEMQRNVYQVMVANAALNSFQNVIAINAGLGDKESSVWVSQQTPVQVGSDFVGAVSLERFQGVHAAQSNSNLREQIRLITVDSMKVWEQIPDDKVIRFIKLDVEEMELQVMRGAMATIKRYMPVIYFESDNQVKREISDLLTPLGYKLYLHPVDYFNKDNYDQISKNIVAYTSYMVLAVTDEHIAAVGESEFNSIWPSKMPIGVQLKD